MITEMAIIEPNGTGLRTSGCSQVAASAPTAAPDIVGRTIGRIAALSSMFDRLNPPIPVSDCCSRPSLVSAVRVVRGHSQQHQRGHGDHRAPARHGVDEPSDDSGQP